jgi:hypothetical protein
VTTHKLDDETFKESFGDAMLPIAAEVPPPFDFAAYIVSIPKEDYEGYDCSAGIVNWRWRSDDGIYEHVLLSTKEDPEVFMVIVLDRINLSVLGHRLLDLNRDANFWAQ